MRIFLLLTVIVMGGGILAAQSIDSMFIVPGSVKQEPGELISRELRDANGVTAAGLIIYSDLKGLSYQSYNGVVKVNSEPGKDFVFLSPDERLVEVYCSGYTPLKIILSEFGIKLKSGTTWSLQLSGNKKKMFGSGWLTVRSTPAGAEFQYEIGKDNWVSKNPPFDTLSLPSNIYPVRLTKEFYKSIDDTIEIKTKERISKSYTMERLKGFLIIKARDENNKEISGANIYLNGKLLPEKTPYSKRVTADNYAIRIEMEGYLVDSASVKVRDEDHPESKEFVLRKIGIVTFKGTPFSSVVSRDDLGRETLIGTVPANGAFVTQMRPQDYQLIFRLGKKVKKYTDLDVSEYQGDMYDEEHSSLSVTSEKIEKTFSIERTEGKAIRWNFFGNNRLAQLTDGVEVNSGVTPVTLTPALVSTVIGYPVNSSFQQSFQSFHLILDYNPISISVNGFSSEAEKKLNDTLYFSLAKMSFVDIEASWMPVSFWEKVYPFLGACYLSGRFEGTLQYGAYSYPISGYQITNDEETRYHTPGIVAGALVRLPVLSMFDLAENEGYMPDIVIRMKYRHLLDTKAFQSQFSVQFGVAMRLPFLAGGF